MNIAIIGAGISGLTAAHRLHSKHETTLFEANDYIGGHTHTVDVAVDGERHAIDTGFIVFNDWTYPNFVSLLEELDVPSKPTAMSFSVSCPRRGIEYGSASVNALLANRTNAVRPSFYRMIADIVRFNRTAAWRVLGEATSTAFRDATVGAFLEREGYSQTFADHYLLPMGSAIWSCPTGKFAEFPIRLIVEFYRNHGLLNFVRRPTWRTIRGGSRKYVDAILRRFTGRLRMRTPIQSVRRSPTGVEITPRGGSPERFDHVVFACHSDQALRLLADASPVEREVLGAFPYERNVAVLHTDERMLPSRRRAWSSWNYRLSPTGQPRATVTYCMNILQHLRSKQTFCVSLNSEDEIDPARVLGRFEYAHPVFTTRRDAAQARHDELIGVNGTSFCGAYWGNGFHEDGVASALAVCRQLASAGERAINSASNDHNATVGDRPFSLR